MLGELPYLLPPPSSVVQVRLPARHLGRTAASMLLERIGGDTQPLRTVVLRAEIARPPLAL